MRLILISAFAVFLSGCATQYKPNSFWNAGGFTETEIQPGLFQVRFNGNELTSQSQTADFAMLRASDLCLAKGMKYMLMGEVDTRVVAGALLPGSSTTTTNVTATAYGNTAYGTGTSYTSTTPPTQLYRPQSGLVLRCVPQEGQSTWDAAFLSRSLRAKYKIESN